MLSIFNGLRDLTLASVAVRLLLAVVCGGAIGIEREFKRRPAGFRTHILICLGAAITTLTSQYLYLYMHYFTDIARFGAQVVAGIGFIGAGTIIVTRHQRVKGLTTAAGLWAAAIIGLALGGGFYEGGIFATVLLLITERAFARLEYHIIDTAPEINLYIEYENRAALDSILRLYRQQDISVLDMQVTRSAEGDNKNASAIFSLRLSRKCTAEELVRGVSGTQGVVSVEDL